MTHHRAVRTTAWAMIAGVVAVGALIVSVWLVGSQGADRVNDSLRAGCARGVARDFESLERERDLQAVARATDQPAVVMRAGARATVIGKRLPARPDQGTVARFCRELYP